jgi:hypothetical protein
VACAVAIWPAMLVKNNVTAIETAEWNGFRFTGDAPCYSDNSDTIAVGVAWFVARFGVDSRSKCNISEKRRWLPMSKQLSTPCYAGARADRGAVGTWG